MGSVDGAPGIADDVASDSAIDVVVRGGLFELREKRCFDFRYHWDAVDEMAADFESNWRRRRGDLSDDVLEAARREFSRRGSDARLCSRERLMLATYDRSSR